MPVSAVSIDQLTALNDEIAALVRAGVPLEQGLATIGRQQRGPHGRAAEKLAERLQRGDSLPAAVEAAGLPLPASYRAVIAAGLASGSLPEALAAVNRQAGAAASLRATLRRAAIYPLVVCLVAWILLVVVLGRLVPAFEQWYANPQVAWQYGFLSSLREAPELWFLAGPAVLLLAAAAMWLPGFLSGRRASWMLRLPVLKGPGERYEWSTFSELLAMLVEHEVPAPQALRLAAESCSLPELKQLAHETATAIEHGQPADSVPGLIDTRSAVPAALRGQLRHGLRQARVAVRLRQLAEDWQIQAGHQAMLIVSAVVPLVVAAIGGVVVLLYCLAVFLPLTQLLQDLVSQPL